MDNSVQILQSVMDAFPDSNRVQRLARRSIRRIRKYMASKRKPRSVADMIIIEYGVSHETVHNWSMYLSDQTHLTSIAIGRVLLMAGRRSIMNATSYDSEIIKIVEVVHLIKE